MCRYKTARFLFCLCLTVLMALSSVTAVAGELEKQPENKNLFEVLTPSTGSDWATAKSAAIDYSNLSRGYVMCRFTGQGDRAAVQISKQGSKKTYTYFMESNMEFEAFPLSQQDGNYHIAVYERISGNTYCLLLSMDIDVKLEDECLPFLYSSSVVRFDAGAASVKKAAELTENSQNADDKADAILDYITENISYDRKKNIKSGYTSNPDDTLRTGKGICLDYAVLTAAMLRSQGVPTKVVFGYNPEGQYHAWVSIFTGSWRYHDPARSAGTKTEMPKTGYSVMYVH